MILASSFDPTLLYGGAGAFFAALAVALGFTIQVMRRGLRQSDGQQDEINGLRTAMAAQSAACDERLAAMDKDHQRRLDQCEHRERTVTRKLNVLIGACHAAGVKVPDAIFEN